MKRSQRRRKPEIVARYVAVDSMNVGIHKSSGREDRIKTSVAINGRMNEPLGKGMINAHVSVFPEDEDPAHKDRSDTLGALIGLRPNAQFVVSLEEVLLTRLVVLAATKRIREVHLAFEKPRYGSATVRSFSVSTEPEWFAEEERAIEAPEEGSL